MEDRYRPLLPIGVVQEMTGLSARQVRYYEEQELVVPQRTEGGQRRYSLAEVRELRWIKSWLDQGLDLQEVSHRLEQRRKLNRSPSPPPAASDKTQAFDGLPRNNPFDRI